MKRGGSAGPLQDLPPNAVIQVFDVPTGGAGSAATAGGRLLFRVLDDAVPDYDPDTPEAKTAGEQMNTALEQDVLAQFVSKVEANAGVRVNQAAARAAIGGGEQ